MCIRILAGIVRCYSAKYAKLYLHRYCMNDIHRIAIG